MAKESVLAGTTSHSVNIFIQDSSSTVGAGLAGLVYNTANLVASYTFTGANATRVAITLATLAAVNSAFSSGGFKEIDATNMKGGYRLDVPNAALAAASGQTVTLELHGATNMAPCWVEIELTATNNQDGVRGGMTALPNAAAAAAGGLMILGSNNTAAITIGALTTGAVSITTLTASGAVSFQSTFGITGAVTLSSTLTVGAVTLSALTVTNNLLVSGTATITGAVQLSSTLGITGAVTLSSTLTVGAVTLSALTVTNNLLVSGTATVTGAMTFTGAITATNVSNSITGIDLIKVRGSTINNLISGRVDSNVQLIGTGVIDAAALAADAGNEIADAYLDRVDGIETGITPRQLARLIGAALAGVLSGAATTTVTLKAVNNAGTTRIVATVDSDGNRSALTLTP